MVMKHSQHPSARALVFGTLAAAIRPGPRLVYFADNARLWPDIDSKDYRREVHEFCKPHGFRPAWPSEHFLFPDLVAADVRDDATVKRLLPAAALTNVSRASAVIADVSPFRGPGPNPVVVFEMGIAVALRLPVFAWTDAIVRQQTDLAPRGEFAFLSTMDKVAAAGDLIEEPNGIFYDPAGLKIENFAMVESAAIAGNFTSLSISLRESIAACAAYFDRWRSRSETK